MNLRETIIDKINDSGIKELLVVVDSEHFKYTSKMVYVEVVSSKNKEQFLEFYTKSTIDVGKKDVIPNAYTKIKGHLMTNNVAGVQVDGEANCDDAIVYICTSTETLFIESNLYRIAKLLANSAAGSGVRFGSHDIKGLEAASLVNAFKAESFRRYSDIVYSEKSTRVLGKIYKASKFYSIQKSFVPVFVDYNQIYNPYKDPSLNLEKTKLYKVAVEMNRVVEIGSIKCFMLTHKEICKALGMTHFVRFTPYFLNLLITGMIRSDLPEFPNKSHSIYLRSDVDPIYKLKNTYTEAEYFKLAENLTNSLDNESEASLKEFIQERMEVLASYRKVDTLYKACYENRNRLISTGASILDGKEKINVVTLHSYLSEARLQY